MRGDGVGNGGSNKGWWSEGSLTRMRVSAV